MSAESPRHARVGAGGAGGPLTVPAQPPSDRSIIDAVSGFINDVTLSSSSAVDSKDVIQWARFETADINEPTPEGDSDNDISPLLLILGYGSGVQVWLIPPTGEAQEVLSWRQGTVRVLRILPTPQHGDCFASKRPLIALCDSASPGPSFCSLSFISIRGGEQVKSIKFKNPILDVLANKRSVVVSFSERFAVFDAATLEDRLAITTCYPCPCPLGGSAPINPLALGDRWLAYADRKLNQSKRSSGGCESEGVTSYTATVLHAAKSLSKGLRGLGESVAHSLSGTRGTSQSPSPPNADLQQPGVVTVLDIEGNEEEDGQDNEEPYDPIVAHFVAHSEAIIALKFDASGMLLVTADRRGHDFHVFRINPHPCGPSLASVHHLYVLHRGDTTAKVQDIAISPDSRWAAISTLRGTTHIFALSPYGGACGLRTHTAPRLVNRQSRFHRSAGLPIHTAANTSGSPVSDGVAASGWFPNPRLPPYPLPVTNPPLAQLRPTANLPTHTITRTSSGRQRLSSLSEDSNAAPLLARARFGPPPAPAPAQGGAAARAQPVAALYLVASTGCLSHIALHPRPARNIPKEKICDESPIELDVEPIAQWPLARPAGGVGDLLAPLPPSNPLLQPLSCRRCADICMSEEERWLSQVEIVTHAGPHRRLWMGPQFVFKTYNCTGSNSSLSEAEAVEVDTSAARSVARSTPVNMPGVRPIVPVLIDSGSASECSLEHSPSDSFRRKSLLAESGRATSVCDVQLKEDLAEAMKEDHGWRERAAAAPRRERVVEREVDALGAVHAARATRAPPPLDADAGTAPNCDENAFRPVVRAPAPLPAAPLMLRPLPRTTTIPAQPLAPGAPPAPAPQPAPLATHVLIPAELTTMPWPIAHDDLPEPPECFPEPTPRVSVERLPADIERPSSRNEEKRTETVSEASVGESPKGGNSDALESKSSKGRRSEASEKDDGETYIPPKEVAVKRDKRSRERSAEKSKNDKSNEKKEKENRSDNCEASEKNDGETNTSPKEVPVKRDKRSRERSTEKSKKDKSDEKKENRSDNSVKQKDKSNEKKEKENRSDNSAKQKDKCDENKEKENRSENSAKQKVIEEAPRTEITEPDGRAAGAATKVASSVDDKPADVNTDLKREESGRECDSARDRRSAERAERQCDDSKSLPKSNRPADDIQPPTRIRIKKSPTPKSVSDRDSELSVKDNESKKVNESKYVKEPKDFKETKEPKEIKKQKESKGNKETRESNEFNTKESKALVEDKVPEKVLEIDKKAILSINDEPTTAVTIKLPSKKDSESKRIKSAEPEIKTEEQAWDMLINESDKPITLDISQQITIGSEDKPKVKKNRKLKKSQDEAQSKDDDSFVEIHAIEEKQQCSGDLVSISTPYEDLESSAYLVKSKKRMSKSCTPEKKDDYELKLDVPSTEDYGMLAPLKNYKKYDDDIEVTTASSPPQISYCNMLKAKKHPDGTASETSSFYAKEPTKPYKSKSLSPYPELRKVSEKPIERVDKDVYVIDTAGEEFPEIQITRGTKPRKRSPQPVERKVQEKEPVIEKPAVKSWSSIAASKNVKKETEINVDIFDKKSESEEKKRSDDDIPVSSTSDLQEKLFELCKRTDIMVAECDTPTELNFVEEHHSVLHDLPPLEPLDFGLDDFKLEVMRDSLLDVSDTKITSPICKINIDDILSSIKETTSKVIESSTFNLIDLEKVPAKKEKGFSVIESHKITSQEVKLDDDLKEEMLEKSSDDDNTSPVTSTDSDKEDKKSAGASNLVTPSSKQSAKSKKSRRKKK